jgi:molecular chaperone DnaK
MSAQTSIRWGIDLGTTNSSIAIVRENEVLVIADEVRSELTPSVVAFRGKPGPPEVLAVGRKAKLHMTRAPRAVAFRFKNEMGNPNWAFPVPEADRGVAARELSGHVLGELKNRLALLEGLPPLHGAIVTVPAAFTGPQRDDTLNAASGIIPYVQLLPEPAAAALAFGRTVKTSHNPIWLVYDLGGGTFDAALVRAEDGVFTIIDNEGDRTLGGADLDAAIVKELLLPALDDHVRRRVVERSAEQLDLQVHAEDAKCELSNRSTTTVDTTLGHDDVVVPIRQSQVDALQVKLFGRTIRICRELMQRNGFTARNIERVILVGGPTLSPFLRRMIQHGADDPSGGPRVEGLGINLDQSVDPLTAVARGAAIFAASQRLPVGVSVPEAVEDSVVRVDVQVPSQVPEARVLVAGRIRALREAISVGGSWSVVIERVDDATGTAAWASSHVNLSNEGTFAHPVSLEKGHNVFRVRVFDQERRQVKTDSGHRFEVLRDIGIGELTLPRGFGVADVHGKTVWFFRKGGPLGSEQMHEFVTTTALKMGSSADLIVIPVVEGFSEKASLNAEVYTWTISAEAAGVDVPAGSRLNVTLKLDHNQSPSQIEATLPDFDIALSSERLQIGADPAKVENRLGDAKTNLELCRKVMHESPAIAAVVRDVTDHRLVEAIEENLRAGSTENTRPWTRAADLSLELARLLDPHLEEVDRLLAWLPHRARCDENVEKARSIVEKTGGLSTGWIAQFKVLCDLYAKACAAHDRRESQRIAFGLIPAHFQTDEQLRQRVGNQVIEEVATVDRTVAGRALKGTIEVA